MNVRHPVTADDLDAVVTCLTDRLRPAVSQDWSGPAGTLEWKWRATPLSETWTRPAPVLRAF